MCLSEERVGTHLICTYCTLKRYGDATEKEIKKSLGAERWRSLLV